MLASPTPLRIAVAGAGFAGLATASLLARDGHEVTVHEKFESPRPVGAGILVQPSGLAAMRVLGIEEEVLAHGAAVRHLLGVTPAGRPVVDVRYERWRAHAFGLGLHRGVLFEALWRLAQAEGVRIVTGSEVHDLTALAGGHDLVVIADGAASTLRAQSGLAARAHLYPWGALWAVLDDAADRYGSTLWQWYRGARQMMGIMPTGRGPDGGPRVVSLFWSLRADRLQAWRDQGLAAFKRELLTLHPEGSPLLDQLREPEQLAWARYHDVLMPAYHGSLGRTAVAVVGDAAHATSPQLGQGTNLALLDAVALARCLRERGDEAPTTALARYTRQRKRHLHFYGQASRWLTPLFQSDQGLLPWLRDVFMGPATRWPIVGPLTLETLVGVRTSWLGGSPLEMPQAARVASTALPGG